VGGVVEIETRYVPVPVVLEPRETVNSMSPLNPLPGVLTSIFSTDQGSLRVTLLTGHDILAVDRGGKSDPYAVFTLNGERVFKSSTKKKTVNPEWHEDFPLSVVSIRISEIARRTIILCSHHVSVQILRWRYSTGTS
jgi:Ca2+-dependent lipid-binding protein